MLPRQLPPPVVAMQGVSKSFGGQRVLDSVDFDILPGEVHVLAGENGAGKSTLMRILSGVLRADAGRIMLSGREVHFRSVHDASRAGIAMIHQELSLAPSMSVMDNLFLGVERVHLGLLLNRPHQRGEAAAALERVGLRGLDPAQRIAALPLPARQLVEIAKALLRQAHVLIMDEPTSALPGPDAERLFALISELTSPQRARPAAIIYITHRMEEIYRLADRITVLRDGHHVITSFARDLPREELVRAIVGRDVHRATPPATQAAGDSLLEAEGITVAGQRGPAVRDISFNLHAGEIIGLAGLQGSGAGALLHGLFGDRRLITGQLRIRGKAVHPGSPREAMARGIALLTDDRATLGLCRDLSVSANLTLACLPALSPHGLRRPGRERNAATRAIQSFRIRCRSHRQSVRTLSGGNQQKVALGKWLLREPRILLLNDPTRGVDIAARQEIYTLIGRAAAAGAGILLASTDLDELLELSDRIIVLHRGRISGTFDRPAASRERIMAAAMGGGVERVTMETGAEGDT